MFGEPRQILTTEGAESTELAEKGIARIQNPETHSFPTSVPSVPSVLSVLSVVKNSDLSP
jgi:hypothetical protein